MENEIELQKNFDKLESRVKAKAAELKEATSDERGMIAQVVEASQKERAALVDKRLQLVNLIDLLMAELVELTTRRNAAELAIYDYRVTQAIEETKRLDEISRATRQEMSAAAKAHLHYINTPQGRSQTPEDARQLLKVTTEKERTTTEAGIAERATRMAAARRDGLIAEAQEVRKRLGAAE